MPRATSILQAAQRQDGRVADTLILPFAQRQVQQGFVFGANGTCIELDFAEPVLLRTDDALVLEDGSLVEVVAEAEPLIEAKVSDAASLARLAWHLGSRHVPVQVLERRLRMRRDPAIETFLESLGIKVLAIEAPFEPEGGADAASLSHEHTHHEHGHGAHHDHHAHCGHDHHHDHHHDHGHRQHDHDHPKG
jgi:urease accessory protein